MASAATFDVIVVGGGHAGTEAALAAARMGARTLLLTQSIETLGQMSCNPAIGGIGKGHLVKEIDALGGEMARAIDDTGIQFRRLNTGKGPAVRSTRAQADKRRYRERMRGALDREPMLAVRQGEVAALLVDGGRVRGVRTTIGVVYRARAVILTTGTFLRGVMHVGDELPLVAPDTPMAEVVLVMTQKTFGVAGVLDGAGRLAGIVTDGDLRRHITDNLLGLTAADVMTGSPKFTTRGILAAEALRRMNEWKVNSVFVVEDGAPVGILRVHDVLRAGAV